MFELQLCLKMLVVPSQLGFGVSTNKMRELSKGNIRLDQGRRNSKQFALKKEKAQQQK